VTPVAAAAARTKRSSLHAAHKAKLKSLFLGVSAAARELNLAAGVIIYQAECLCVKGDIAFAMPNKIIGNGAHVVGRTRREQKRATSDDFAVVCL